MFKKLWIGLTLIFSVKKGLLTNNFAFMLLSVKKIEDKDTWEKIFLQCGEKTFLQSWNWGEVNQALGNKIFRFGVYEQEKLVGCFLAVQAIVSGEISTGILALLIIVLGIVGLVNNSRALKVANEVQAALE